MGGGTIIIEAAQVWRDIDPIGIDVSPKSIEGAWMNAEAAGVKGRVRFIVGDARRLRGFCQKGGALTRLSQIFPLELGAEGLR